MKDKVNTIRIGGEEWFLVTTRNMSFWHEVLLTKGWFYNMKDFGVPIKLRTLSLVEHGTHTSLYHTNPNFTQFKKSLYSIFHSKGLLEKLILTYTKYGIKLQQSLSKCKSNLTPKNLEIFFQEYQKYTPGLQITGVYGASATEKLRELLFVDGFSNLQVDEFVSTATFPIKSTPLLVSQKSLLKIGLNYQLMKDVKQMEKSLSRWVRLFGNIPVNYCDDPWTIDDAKKQLNEMLTKSCAEEFQKLTYEQNIRRKRQRQLLKMVKNEEIRALAYGLSVASYLNEYRKSVFSKVSLAYRGIFQVLAKNAGSDNWRDCFYMLPDELLQLAKGDNISLSSIMKERNNASMSVSPRGKFHLLNSGQTSVLLKHLKQNFRASNNKDYSSSVQGVIANRGKIIGPAKVVLKSNEFGKFKAGDILITTMTSVDFIPLMKIAAAFVTNEGGITSHAAIVAREFNKPCIIGTKIATKVFKDGDLVELDADKGIVRKIK